MAREVIDEDGALHSSSSSVLFTFPVIWQRMRTVWRLLHFGQHTALALPIPSPRTPRSSRLLRR